MDKLISTFVAGFKSLDAITAAFLVASALSGIASGLALHYFLLPEGMVLRVLGYEVSGRHGQGPRAAQMRP